MKRLLLLISFSILCLISFTQTNIQQDNRVSPILRNALAAKNGYYIYGRTTASRFINIAVLNQSSHILCWFTCHGRLFDSTKLTNQEFEQVTSKQLDPFTLYQHICDNYLAEFATARDIYRVHGDKQSFDRLNSTYRAVFAMVFVQAAKTSLQKLIAIENVRKHILTQLGYLNCANPSVLSHDPLYATNKEQAGIMVKTNDSTVYYNIDPTSAVAKISLYKKAAGQLYIQNRFSEIIDSVALQPEKFDLLQKEKTDVFLLYRGWLELQWQGTLSAIRRQGVGLYNQVNVQNEKEVKELYNQLNTIGAKINQLNSPEAKSIEQAVYDTYKNETSEINYIPLLGIGYSLTQTRGQKEYELTNHLGNVLATVSDKKNGVPSSSNSSLIDHYEPDIVSAQDYYPFGMLQPGRSYLSSTGDKYRYGFNGKENDNEVKGEGNQQDYGMRVYDPRLGKFLSVDPLSPKFPYYSPYQFAGNMPIHASDLDGLEPDFRYKGNGINGVGLYDQTELASIQRHSTILRVGTKDKQFQLQWLLNNNGEVIGYLASRVVPEEEYKNLYGGRGEGLQQAYVIQADKFFEFGKNLDKYYDYSRNAEMNDVMYGEIERSPIKSLFDPRAWLLGEITGVAGKIAGQLFLRSATILSKAERLAVFHTKLGKAASVGSQAEAIKLINKTLDEVEDAYSGVAKAEGIPNRDDGRMYGILDDKYVETLPDGTKIAKTKGNRIVLSKDGGFEIQSKDGSKIYFKKAGAAKKAK
jgi:RHS repeat-associated protein